MDNIILHGNPPYNLSLKIFPSFLLLSLWLNPDDMYVYLRTEESVVTFLSWMLSYESFFECHELEKDFSEQYWELNQYIQRNKYRYSYNFLNICPFIKILGAKFLILLVPLLANDSWVRYTLICTILYIEE